MWMFKLLLPLVGIPSIFLALVGRGVSRRGGFFAGLLLAIFGVVLPVFVFLASAFMVPDWKGAAASGWLDCFHEGKLALTPLVLWAAAAFNAVEICRVRDRTRPWIVLGYFLGAVVSSVCAMFGLFCVPNEPGKIWLLVPFYVAVWYSVRAANLIRHAPLKPGAYLAALLGSLPLWIGSVLWSRRIYETLPNNPPECFVVTAASRGHAGIVGPFIEISRRGRTRTVNAQSATLWQFEHRWHARAPRGHAVFRRIYNRLGPAIACRITRPWMADVAYLAIKPAELAAAFLLRLDGGRAAHKLNEPK
jgi:hypothetical protein